MIPDDPDIASRTRSRVMWRLMPYLIVLYVIAYIDRVNVSYAALKMTADLGFTATTYGFGAGVFFIGYFLLEVPGAVIAQRIGVRRLICRIMVTWGLLAMAMGFINNAQQFYWLRFLIGAAEAGFFPAMIVYLGHWFRAADRGKAVALFMSAISLAVVVGGPVSGALLKLNWFGLEGWRWLFILEGLPAVMLGITTWFFLTERPENAKWLPDDEKAWLVAELARERAAREGGHSTPSIGRALCDPRVLLFAAAYFFGLIASNGLLYWLPTMIKSLSGFSDFAVSLLVSLPYSLGVIAKVLAGWSSDRTGERRWHTVALLLFAAGGLAALALLQTYLALALISLTIAVIGLTGYTPSFWAYATSFLAGTANAAAIGLINSIGNLGSFVGPYAMGWLKENSEAGDYTAGVLSLAASSVITALLVLAARPFSKPKPLPAPALQTSP